MTLQEIEQALDQGRVWARMAHGVLWQARRNGRTKTWKTRPHAFRIPIKAGFRATGYIDHENWSSDFVIKDAE